MGNISLLNTDSVAVIGSRNSSEYGEKITSEITKDLVNNGVTIVSGMAVGIDTVAHKTCLEYGGKTIAVLGGGFKNIYPKENTELFSKIIKNGGLVLSEFPYDEPVQKKNFPKRNRIISGLSLGVLVVEAAYRSGTSITARLAKNQGRKVFCVPNGVGNKNSYGTIELLKKGAILVSKASDILSALNISYKENVSTNSANVQLQILDENSKKIINCIKANPYMDADKICIKTGIDITTVNQLLTLLEIEGHIINNKNGYDVKEAFYE